MTINQLVDQYKEIHTFLNKNWPLGSHMKRVFGRSMKLTEELGELANEILSSMHLQRQDKIDNFSREALEDEYADVLGSLILLGIELDIDIEKAIQKKIAFTKRRFDIAKK